MARNSLLAAILLVLLSACGSSHRQIDSVEGIHALYAPWDGLEDNTVFHCFRDGGTLYFFYEVEDESLTLTENFRGEADVEPEDRVEIFFSSTYDLTETYYCAEIDPLGRVMDYSCRYYAEMDYGWNFKTLESWGRITDNGYIVGGKIALRELSELGIDVRKTFYMGVFRADFRPDRSVNWYSYVKTGDKAPNFHKPGVLFPVIIK